MLIEVDFNSEEAIYIQLCNQIIMGIATSVIQEGDSLPSVRQLADRIGVNMHTVNKAYSVLKREGYISLDKRRGAVIALDIDKMEELEEMKKQCMSALDNVRDVTPDNVGSVLDQAVAMEQKNDDMRDKYFKKQLQRLKKGKCKPQSGIVFSEVLTDFERMGDHTLNIAQQYKEMAQ